MEPLRIADVDLKARLRAFLKNSIDLVLRQDDFNDEEKAHLASAIAQVGELDDMSDLNQGNGLLLNWHSIPLLSP